MTLRLLGYLVLVLSCCLAAPAEDNKNEDEKLRHRLETRIGYIIEARADWLRSGKATPEEVVAKDQDLQKKNCVFACDGFREAVVKHYPNDWKILRTVARLYSNDRYCQGYEVDGTFFRGPMSGRGEPKIYLLRKRDCVRAIQLMQKAEKLALLRATKEELKGFYLEYSRLIIKMHQGDLKGLVEKKTHFLNLPKPEEGYVDSQRRKAQLNTLREKMRNYKNKVEMIDAVFHRGENLPRRKRLFPITVGEMKPSINFPFPKLGDTDIALWRQILDKCRKHGGKAEADTEYAIFLKHLFGAATHPDSYYTYTPYKVSAQVLEKALPKLSAIEQKVRDALSKLEDNEVLYVYEPHVMSFKLPSEFDYVTILRDTAKTYPEARYQLVDVLFQRRKFKELSILLPSVIAESKGRRKSELQMLLKKLTAKTGAFAEHSDFIAGKTNQVVYRHTNGMSVRFTARRIDHSAYFLKALNRDGYVGGEELSLRELFSRLAEGLAEDYLKEEVASWAVKLAPTGNHAVTSETVKLPFNKAGAYLLTAKLENGNECSTVIRLINTVLVRRRLNSETMLWAVDPLTGKGIPDLKLEMRPCRGIQNMVVSQKAVPLTMNAQGFYRIPHTKLFIDTKKHFVRSFVKEDSKPDDGIADDLLSGDDNLSWYLVPKDSNRMVSISFPPAGPVSMPLEHPPRTFMITDRPIYRPGQTVKLKGWIGMPYFRDPDLKENPLPKTLALTVRDAQWNRSTYSVDVQKDGGFEWTIDLLDTAKLGKYECSVEHGGDATFRVEEYKKGEFFVTVSGPTKQSKDLGRVPITVEAKYYDGKPVINGKVTLDYRIRAYPDDGNRYLQTYPWLVETLPPEKRTETIEVPFTKNMTTGPNGKATFHIDCWLAESTIKSLESCSLAIDCQVTDSSRRVAKGSEYIRIIGSDQILTRLDKAFYRIGETVTFRCRCRPDFDLGVETTLVGKLWRLDYDAAGKASEALVKELRITTNAKGIGSCAVKVTKSGQYHVQFAATQSKLDDKPDRILFHVVGKTNERIARMPALELTPEKRLYDVGEVIRVLINCNQPDASVLLIVNEGMPSEKLEVVTLKGKQAVVEFPAKLEDAGSFTVYARCVNGLRLENESAWMAIQPKPQILTLEVKPDKQIYEAGEKAVFRIKTLDCNNKPVTATVAFTVFDNALLPLVDFTPFDSIDDLLDDKRVYARSRSLTWNQPQNHGCFGYSFHLFDLPDWEVPNPYQLDFDSIWTPEFANGRPTPRQEAELLRLLEEERRYKRRIDMLQSCLDRITGPSSSGSKSPSKGQTPIGNFHTEKEEEKEQYIAAVVRRILRDSAYWNPSIQTDENGEATVEFTMPENLTKWQVRAWAFKPGPFVGEAKTSVVTTKNLLVRLQSPRFFVENDRATLSANISNALKTEKKVKVTLVLDDHLTIIPKGVVDLPLKDLLSPENSEGQAKKGLRMFVSARIIDPADVPLKNHNIKIKNLPDFRRDDNDKKKVTVWDGESVVLGGTITDELVKLSEETKIVTIPAGGQVRVDWHVKAIKAGNTKIVMKALTNEESDAMEVTVPVNVYGIRKQIAACGAIPIGKTELTLLLTIPTKRKDQEETLTVSVTSSLANTMIEALPFLVQYPHGCTEQTLNKFVPTLIAYRTLKHMDLTDAELRKVLACIPRDGRTATRGYVQHLVRVGVARLISHNKGEGWSWFPGGEFNPYMTALVIRGLRQAQADPEFKKVFDGEAKRAIDDGVYKLDQLLYNRLQQVANQGKKGRAETLDALIFSIIAGEKGRGWIRNNQANLLFQFSKHLNTQGKCLAALGFAKLKKMKEVNEILVEIEKAIKTDKELNTAYLEGGRETQRWYCDDIETTAIYLKLLCRVKPTSDKIPMLANWLVLNRRHGDYWKSTRDTAAAIDAIAEYMRCNQKATTPTNVQIFLGNKRIKSISMTGKSLSNAYCTAEIPIASSISGKRTVRVVREGGGYLYCSAIMPYVSVKSPFVAAGKEVQVSRRYFKVVKSPEPDVKSTKTELKINPTIQSGEGVEVELTIQADKDYEYLSLEDFKPAGFESVEKKSGYVYDGHLHPYREFRDDRVCFYIQRLPKGKHTLRYTLRAETPGKYSAFPARIEAMYDPKVSGNSDEAKIRILDKK